MQIANRVLAAVVLIASSAHAQGVVTAPLRSGPLVLDSSSTAAFLDSLARSSTTAIHGIARLVRPPTAVERRALASQGLAVMTPLGRVLYRVTVAPQFRQHLSNLPDTVLALALLRPEDKVSRSLWRGTLPVLRSATGKPDSVDADQAGAVAVIATTYAEIDSGTVAAAFAGLGIAATRIGRGRWRGRATPGQARALARYEFVRWVEPVHRTFPDLDVVREAVHVNAVQPVFRGIAYGLTGENVDVGLFDFGIDETHADLASLTYCGWIWYCLGASRVTVNDQGVSAHGTHNAGVIAGTGRRSALADSWGLPNGGSAFQWRGLAPKARLLDVPVLATGTGLLQDPRLVDFVTVNGLDVSNHSYPLSADGWYDNLTAIHDALVRGDYVVSSRVVPARLHVHSAGNSGSMPAVYYDPDYDSYYYDGGQFGYFGLTNQMKNGLVVGNYNTVANRIASSSSLGPTYDGRIKPDIVAPGTNVTAPGYCKDGDLTNNPIVSGTLSNNPVRACDNRPASAPLERRNFYFPATGTSTASAVVTGVMALVLQAYAEEFALDLDVTPPLPSTLRAIAVNSAQDIDAAAWYRDDGSPMTVADGLTGPIAVRAFPGPDFTTGYGVIDAAQAVEVVRSEEVIEGRVEADCDVRSYRFYVSASGFTKLRVTLAWDDPASDGDLVPDVTVHLLNDLDLTLVDPVGHRHYPWKLNQRVVDAQGVEIADADQTCGSDVTVERVLQPTEDPDFHGVGDPRTVSDELVEADLGPAGRGRDHLNNLEQVDVLAMPGWWKAEVRAFRLQEPGQPFSLVGVPRRKIVKVFPGTMCERWRMLCPRPVHDICDRYPELCEGPQRIPFETDTLFLTGRDSAMPLLIPLTTACGALGSQQDCESGRAGPLTLTVGPVPIAVRVSVLTGAELVATRNVARAEQAAIRLPPETGIPRFVLIEPRERGGREVPVPSHITRDTH